MKKLLPLMLLLSGCHAANRAADDKVLCDPTNGDAYYVEPNVGDTSFVRLSPQFKPLCFPPKPTSGQS